MRPQKEINRRKNIIEALNKANYSETSTAYIVNTYFLKGICKHWDKQTKEIIKNTED